MPTPKEQYEAREIAFSNMSPADKEAEITRRKADIETVYNNLPEAHRTFLKEIHKSVDPNVIEEYVVITKKGLTYEDTHNNLCRDTSADDSVDSNVIPDRAVTCTLEKTHNSRITHYNLSNVEAEKLKSDSRVETVERKVKPYYKTSKYQSGNFNRGSSQTGENQNWGLLRHINNTNNYGNSSSDPGGTYDYVLDGTGVDIVVMDTGIVASHPEWEDPDGVSRLKQIDWFQAAGVSGYSWPSGMYADTQGHGTHVTSTVAGKNFGWAKNADIYSVRVLNGGVNMDDVESSGYTAFDLVRLWHNKKNDPNDAAYTGRPTVVNMSFGVVEREVLINPFNDQKDYVLFNGAVQKCNYRGTDYSSPGNNLSGLEDYGFSPANYHYVDLLDDGNYWLMADLPNKPDASEIVEIQQMTDAGIIVCKAAGNEGSYIVEEGHSDYNNQFHWYQDTWATSGNTYFIYSQRGGVSSTESNSAPAFLVGSMNNSSYSSTYDRPSIFSNRGPAVKIFFAGSSIHGAMIYSSQGYSSTYHWNNSYYQGKKSGTSMASPQCAGMCALILQVHSDWTPLQVFNYARDTATETLYTSGQSNDFTNTDALWGGSRKVGYLPMAGRTPFSYG